MQTSAQRSSRWSWVMMVALLLSSLAVAPALAQTSGTVRGKVVAAGTLRPLTGAQVSVPGTGVGALTNSAGEFALTGVPAGQQTIAVQMLGYDTERQQVTVAAGQTLTVNFQLAEQAIALDEVVVTGSARETRRREVAATVTTVNSEKLETVPISNVSQMLQGRAAGVSVLPGGGTVGQGTKIVLRGPSSLSQGVQPLIYVDGVRMDNSSDSGVWTGGASWSGLDDINPADIERIEVVKGAAAASLYGTEASAGVIQVFTKKGSQDQQRWSYSSELGASSTPREWWDVSVYSDWFYDNYVEQNALLQEHQLSTSGGKEGLSYYVSGTYRDQEGQLPGNAEDYYGFRGNLQFLPRKDMRLQFTTGYSRRGVDFPQDANNIYGYGINALVGGESGTFMPIDQIGLIDVTMNNGRFTGGLSMEYTPVESFTNRVTVGADIVNADNVEFHPYGANRFNPFGRKNNYRREATNLSLEYMGIFKVGLGENISSTTTAGFQAYQEEIGANQAYGRDFPAPGLSVVSAAANTTGWEFRRTTKSAGFLVQQDVGLWDRLFLNFGLRADGHSAFGDDHPYEIYPKGGVSYVISDHGFWPETLGSLRVRAAYGTAGRQPGAFDAVQTYEAVSAFEGIPAVTPANIGNPELAPEVSHELEAGFDAGLFDNRLSLEATYYDQRTEGALLPFQYPPSDGFVNTQLINIGEIRNQGVELSANAVLINSQRLRWDAGANVHFTENEVTDLGDLPELYQHWTQVTRKGFPVASFFGDRFVVEDGQVVEREDDFIGPAFPTRTVQLSSGLTLGNGLSFRALVDHSGGHFVESSTVRWMTRTKVPHGNELVPEELWGKSVASICHRTGDLAVLAFCDQPWPSGGRGNVVMPADYWKLRELSLTYQIPAGLGGRLGLTNSQVYVSGRNLWRSLEAEGRIMEAEANYASNRDLSAQEYFIPPIPRQIAVGVRVGF